ncbi:hypothetical protein GE09DRAFT_571455 [Coniochaeta sp. 2T2.1]|nr:hypothetical protein GE09DRAFT_571455 [Coniochaeta sp. 2T2.1]
MASARDSTCDNGADSCTMTCDSGTKSCTSGSPLVFIALGAGFMALLLLIFIMEVIYRLRGRGDQGLEGGRSRGSQGANITTKDGIELKTLDSVCPTHIHSLDAPSKGLDTCTSVEASFADDICAVCLDLLTEQDEVRRLRCSHVFHTRCIDPWFHRKHFDCPLCKCIYVVRPTAEVESEPRLTISTNTI